MNRRGTNGSPPSRSSTATLPWRDITESEVEQQIVGRPVGFAFEPDVAVLFEPGQRHSLSGRGVPRYLVFASVAVDDLAEDASLVKRDVVADVTVAEEGFVLFVCEDVSAGGDSAVSVAVEGEVPPLWVTTASPKTRTFSACSAQTGTQRFVVR
jgi:hypothetical protein